MHRFICLKVSFSRVGFVFHFPLHQLGEEERRVSSIITHRGRGGGRGGFKSTKKGGQEGKGAGEGRGRGGGRVWGH